MADNPIMALISVFIGVSIMLGIGVAILSGTNSSMDCTTLSGYAANGTNNDEKFPDGTWSGTCHDIQVQSQNSFGLLVIILIVIAAVAILVVVRML